MKLTLQNGNYDSDSASIPIEATGSIDDPGVELIREELADEFFEFAILESTNDLTYIQCAIIEDTDRYSLEYQDGSTKRHYSTKRTVSLSQATAALIWYLSENPLWLEDFEWKCTPV